MQTLPPPPPRPPSPLKSFLHRIPSHQRTQALLRTFQLGLALAEAGGAENIDGVEELLSLLGVDMEQHIKGDKQDEDGVSGSSDHETRGRRSERVKEKNSIRESGRSKSVQVSLREPVSHVAPSRSCSPPSHRHHSQVDPARIESILDNTELLNIYPIWWGHQEHVPSTRSSIQRGKSKQPEMAVSPNKVPMSQLVSSCLATRTITTKNQPSSEPTILTYSKYGHFEKRMIDEEIQTLGTQNDVSQETFYGDIIYSRLNSEEQLNKPTVAHVETTTSPNLLSHPRPSKESTTPAVSGLSHWYTIDSRIGQDHVMTPQQDHERKKQLQVGHKSSKSSLQPGIQMSNKMEIRPTIEPTWQSHQNKKPSKKDKENRVKQRKSISSIASDFLYSPFVQCLDIPQETINNNNE